MKTTCTAVVIDEEAERNSRKAIQRQGERSCTLQL